MKSIKCDIYYPSRKGRGPIHISNPSSRNKPTPCFPEPLLRLPTSPGIVSSIQRTTDLFLIETKTLEKEAYVPISPLTNCKIRFHNAELDVFKKTEPDSFSHFQSCHVCKNTNTSSQKKTKMHYA